MNSELRVFPQEKKYVRKNRARCRILLGIEEIKQKHLQAQTRERFTTAHTAQPITGRATNNICVCIEQMLQQYPSVTQNYHPIS